MTVAPVRSELRAARLALCVVFFAHGAVAGSWAARIPSIKAELGLSAGSLGVALAGAAAGTLAMLPVAGALTARLGSRAVTIYGAVFYGGSLALPPLAPTLPVLFGALTVLGAGAPILDVAMNAYGVELEGRYGRPILSSLHGLWSMGSFTAAVAAGVAAAAGISPSAHLAAAAGVIAGSAGLAAASLPRDHSPSEEDRPERAFVRPSRRLAALGAVAFCAVLAEGASFDWSAVYLREALGAPEGIAAAGLSAFSLLMTGGRLVGDRLTIALGRERLVRYSAVVAAAGLGLALSTDRETVAIVGFGILGGGVASIVPAMFASAGHGRGGGPAIAAVGTLSYVAFFVGPPLIGGVAEVVGLAGGMAMVAVVLLLIPPLTYLARPAAG